MSRVFAALLDEAREAVGGRGEVEDVEGRAEGGELVRDDGRAQPHHLPPTTVID